MITVANLRKEYTSHKKTFVALDGISLSVKNGGRITGLLGPNGAGKTTLMKILSNLVYPTSGTIEIDGYAYYDYIRKNPGVVSVVLEGTRNIYWRLTIMENIEFFLALRGKRLDSKMADIENLLRLFCLEKIKHKQVGRLSKGMQQKIAIIIAFCTSPILFILDEPTLGLDLPSKIELTHILSELKKTHQGYLIISSHDMDFIEKVADDIILLDMGRMIYSDKISNFISTSQEEFYEITIYNDCPGKKVLPNQARQVVYENTLTKFLIGKKDLNDVIISLVAEKFHLQEIKKQENNLESVFKRFVCCKE